MCGSADHRHFEEAGLCLKSGQLSHWYKHMGSSWMWAPELHGYWSWQFAWFGCNTRWVPNHTQIQVVRSPLYSAHEFPNPALPTGFPAEPMHMPWCECQTAQAPSSFYAILATYSALPKVAKWCSSASEHFKTLASSLAEDQQTTWAC